MSYKLIFCDGDSWTAGDIIDPNLDITHVNAKENDSYRLPRVWPHKLGKLCGIEVKNNSVAGSSNDGIVRRVLDNIPTLLKQYKPEEICVIIGWTSPERKDFFYSHEKMKHWETLYPAELYQKQLNKDVEEFYKTYIKHFWNIEEFSNRYIEHNLLLHHYLENLGIKHYFFNAFYESSGENFNGSLYEKYFLNKRRGLPDVFSVGLVEELKMVHGIMDELVFHEFKNIFEKNFIQISFKKFCDNVGLRWKDRYVMNHPNENMHTKWSEYIYKQLFTEDGYFYGN
tara:strand:- start:409 stop:1260 length:852 start_codon:yes stop_codon:yes gene_type:complete